MKWHEGYIVLFVFWIVYGLTSLISFLETGTQNLGFTSVLLIWIIVMLFYSIIYVFSLLPKKKSKKKEVKPKEEIKPEEETQKEVLESNPQTELPHPPAHLGYRKNIPENHDLD